MKSSSGKRGSWDSERPDREYSPGAKGRRERGDYTESAGRINPSEQDHNQKNAPPRKKDAAHDEGDEYDESRENDDYNRKYRQSIGGRDSGFDDPQQRRNKNKDRDQASSGQPSKGNRRSHPGVGGKPYISRSGRSGYGGKFKRKG